MTSNAWSPRTRTIRRPAVCKSLPPIPKGGLPHFVHITYTWNQFNIFMQTNNETALGVLLIGSPPGSNHFPLSGANDTGATYAGAITIQLAPAQCAVAITMLTGAFAGELISGNCNGYNGDPVWSGSASLFATMPNFTGSFTLNIP